MSLWFDDYCGYDGTKNIISLNDSKKNNTDKAVHILQCLSDDQILHISEENRFSILLNARNELNKIKGLAISLAELYALPYLNYKDKDFTYNNYLKACKKTLESKPEIYGLLLQKHYDEITINDFPRNLNINNIEMVINTYLKLIDDLPMSLSFNSKYQMLCSLKRDPIKYGPYPDVSIFESANRILSDLVILFGVRKLLDGVFPEIGFSEYRIELGTESRNAHDIMAINGEQRLNGEAFNVSLSLFNFKKSKSLKKLEKSSTMMDIKLLIYNVDATNTINKPCCIDGVYHLPIDIKI
jgi:hypothetical protein